MKEYIKSVIFYIYSGIEKNIPGNTSHNSILYSYAASVSIHQLFVGQVVPEIKKKDINLNFDYYKNYK